MPFFANNLNIRGIKIVIKNKIPELSKKAKDLTEQRFGKLVAKYPVEERRHGEVVWLCQCDCGKICKVGAGSLRGNNTKSCGCLKREQASAIHMTHGLTNTPIYRSWQSMIQRCNNPKNPSYKNYGGRGIQICDQWLPENDGLINFFTDLGPRPKDLMLERINNDRNYCPDNCKWATWKEQNTNKRIRKDQFWFMAFNTETGEWDEDNNQSNFAKRWGLKSAGCISSCLHGKRKHHKGWIFEKL